MRYRSLICLAAMIGMMLSCWGGPLISRAQSVRPRTMHESLDTYLPDLKLTDVTLSDALDFFSTTGDFDMFVDWKALESVNVDRNTVVNVHLHKTTVRRAMRFMLDQVGAGNLLTFYVEDNILKVTTQEAADSFMVNMVYPVKDLLVSIPYSQAQISNITSSGGGGTVLGGGTSGGGGGGALANSGGGSSNLGSMSNTMTKSPEQAAMDLIKLIQATVRPDIWKDTTSGATIIYWNGSLVVHAPLSVQEAIGGPVD